MKLIKPPVNARKTSYDSVYIYVGLEKNEQFT